MIKSGANSTQNLRGSIETWARWILIFGVFILIVRRAWMSDDAYITLRTVDNFINGYGLTWNVNERVEVFTHPLWMLLLSFFYFFTREAYLTTIFVSLGLASFTLIYLQTKIKLLANLVLVFLVLGFSNTFVDYATSGLENVLNYALFTIFFFQFIGEKKPKENYFKIIFLAGLIGMTRLDLLLIILPLLVYLFFQHDNKWHAIKLGFLAVSPLVMWEVFSYIYYGYMFPNTYYAKVFSGTPTNKLLLQGVFYILASFQRDPITPFVIFLGIIFGLGNKKTYLKFWGIGLVLYLIYIVQIGGDFMVGRFLSIPFLVSILVLNKVFFSKLNIPKTIITAIFVIFIGLLSPMPTFNQAHQDGKLNTFQGIADERDFYFQGTGLLRSKRFNSHPEYWWIDDGMRMKKESEYSGNQIIKFRNVGFFGYYAGPKVYIVDTLALGNAFLAHQPMDMTTIWRVGHYERRITQDLLDSIKLQSNLIIDGKLSSLYDDVFIRTQYDVFDTTRLRYILNMKNFQ